MPPGGLAIRTNDHPLKQEERLFEHKLPALTAFLRANAPDRLIFAGGRRPRIGIVTAGKSYLDVLQALDDLGIDEVRAADFGLRLLKLACTWPIEPETIRRFGEGLDTIIVVEEKRPLIEGQIREVLYGTANQPTIHGKKDDRGEWLFPAKGALDPNQIAVAIGERVLKRIPDDRLAKQVAALKQAEEVLRGGHDIAERPPYFCPGCPHNSSTVVPSGSRAYAGIGCHYMAQSMDRFDRRLDPYGRRGRQLDRRGALLDARPRLPEHRRRHLPALRQPRHPRRHRGRRERHLQDPVQRCRSHDRRPTGRRRPDRGEGRRAGRRRRCPAHRDRL